MRKLYTLIISLLCMIGVPFSASAASYVVLQEESYNIKVGLIVLLIMLCLVILLELILRVLVFKRQRIKGKAIRRNANQRLILTVLTVIMVLVILTGAFGLYRYFSTEQKAQLALQTPSTTPP